MKLSTQRVNDTYPSMNAMKQNMNVVLLTAISISLLPGCSSSISQPPPRLRNRPTVDRYWEPDTVPIRSHRDRVTPVVYQKPDCDISSTDVGPDSGPEPIETDKYSPDDDIAELAKLVDAAERSKKDRDLVADDVKKLKREYEETNERINSLHSVRDEKRKSLDLLQDRIKNLQERYNQ